MIKGRREGEKTEREVASEGEGDLAWPGRQKERKSERKSVIEEERRR